uniref:DUF223 domain-containing protein n=1 Tax=Heterorhabditis bacteriophora TaxID=37862 RepID=A0A1I7X1M6_HETBA
MAALVPDEKTNIRTRDTGKYPEMIVRVRCVVFNDLMPWSHRTWFGSIVVSNEIRTINIFDTFLNLETEIKLEADVLDICNTHNFIMFVTKEAVFIFRVDNVMPYLFHIPMRCVLSPTVFDFKFQPAKWDRVIQKKLKVEIAKDVEKPKRKSHNLLLTATVSTAYLICTLDDRSTVIRYFLYFILLVYLKLSQLYFIFYRFRMFHEPSYIDSGCIEPRIVQKPVEMKIVMICEMLNGKIFRLHLVTITVCFFLAMEKCMH